MDPLVALFTALLAASGVTFLWLSWLDGRQTKLASQPPDTTIALDDLVGGSHPLTPHTIRHTSIR